MKLCEGCGQEIIDEFGDEEVSYCEDCYPDFFGSCCVCYRDFPIDDLDWPAWVENPICPNCIVTLESKLNLEFKKDS